MHKKRRQSHKQSNIFWVKKDRLYPFTRPLCHFNTLKALRKYFCVPNAVLFFTPSRFKTV
ncbi:hypothetical protein HMPREF9193_00212 [Treponema lecithinolyticum ATCC 700332]|uniref:Uncharacterized protein n=1 Tax=Treponema lecithinolyticum ATCC 700332 TaxID=1321815 RepID=A0ABN0P153_TRELE|nr:hypothetical protein HMPREF9193_00212 [Treponema lecithinolyticum ATCC 700332]